MFVIMEFMLLQVLDSDSIKQTRDNISDKK